MNQFSLQYLIITVTSACLSALVLTSVSAQTPANSATAHLPNSTAASALDTKRVNDIEEKKLEVEILKAWLTGGSIVVPLLTGIAAIYWQVRSGRQLKEDEARHAFELKAADMVLTSPSPAIAASRANVLQSLFPQRLPSNFVESFNWDDFAGGLRHEMRVELFRAIAKQPEHKDEIVQAWRQTFPEETWVNKGFPISTAKG